MVRHGIILHSINALIACFSLVILGLVANSISEKDRLNDSIPSNLKSVGLSFLFWPACGGIVDFLLFIFLLLRAQPNCFNVSNRVNAPRIDIERLKKIGQ